MSVLTKVFVVLVNVLSVALVALVIAYVANSQNYRQAFEEERGKRTAAETLAQLARGELAQERQKWEAQLNRALADLSDKSAQLKTMEEQTAAMRMELASVRRQAAQLSAEVSRLSTALKQNQEILDVTLKELNRRREEALKQEARLVELADRNNELQNQVDAYNRQVRRLNEQIAALESEKKQLENWWLRVPADERERITGAAGLAQATQAFEAPPPGVRGKIVKLEKLGDQTLVQVDVGAADRVAPNMKFIIHRGDRFLGNLIILTVSERAAVGRLELPQGEIAVGDTVQSGTF